MRIGVAGCAGRMGRMLVREVAGTEGCRLTGGTEEPGREEIGRDLGEVAGLEPLGVAVGGDPAVLFAQADAVLDFTTPAAAVEHAALAARDTTIHVIGTTGLNAEQEEALAEAARHTAVVRAPNMSIGINLLMVLVEQVARTLDDGYDIEIVEMHHRHKLDAPSGTALGLGRAAAAGRGVDFDEIAQRHRDGPRRRGDIGFAALRGGDVVGDHTVIFAGQGERLELSHKAADRRVYAQGAVRAALWARGKPPGLYSMKDVLGLTAAS